MTRWWRQHEDQSVSHQHHQQQHDLVLRTHTMCYAKKRTEHYIISTDNISQLERDHVTLPKRQNLVRIA